MILKPKTNNEKIIAEKGNKKCLFYGDDICRKGDKTRDCINCARVEYQSLYDLNWDNQEQLQKQLQRLKQENEELQKLKDEDSLRVAELATENVKLKKEAELDGECIDKIIEERNILRKALEEIREIVNEPCMEGEDCNTCELWCPAKEIIVIITEVLQ